MTTITEKITIHSEFGERSHPSQITLSMDGTQPDCPVTFWADGKAVFSLGNDEIQEFCEQLQKLDCTQ
jgi:hypothetical protein